MLAGRLPSTTAMIVACARGIHGIPDDVSRRLVPRPIARTLEAALRVASFGLVPHVVGRTNAIDEVVRTHPAPQLVILGAGLDARAHRMTELSETTVFEVDHPSTQAYKRPRAERLPVLARAVRYVAVDFERDDLGERLEATGHDASEPTTWIWEGVTMYLTRDAAVATLATIAARSANGSTLVLTYATPELSVGSRVVRAARPLVRPAFGLLGEPLRFLVTPEDMAALVRAHGFEVERDLEPFGTIAERVLVTTRGSNGRSRRRTDTPPR